MLAISTTSMAVAAAILLEAVSASSDCSQTSFEPFSAEDFIAAMSPAWNPGNSLDAVPDETSWGQPLIINETIVNSKGLGFNGVRLPVTHSGHFISDSPDYELDPLWLDRVEEVVNMILSNDLPVLVDSHHDSSWLDPSQTDLNQTMALEKFYRMWYQVGQRLACAPSTVAFETINELGGEGPDAAEFLGRLQEVFIRAIHDAGGYNSRRVVVFSGLGDSYAAAVDYFQGPPLAGGGADVANSNPWALTYHYYGPWDFTALAFGRTTWGNEEDKAAIGNDIKWARGNFSDVPLLIGEFAVAYVHTETAARWKWYDFVTRTAAEYDTSVAMWNAGGDFKPDWEAAWRDISTIDILTNGAKGIPNALPDSTVDRGASEHFSSAYVFHRTGDTAAEKMLPFLWNGNTLEAISWTAGGSAVGDGRHLVQQVDYEQTRDDLVLKTAFVNELFGGDAESCTPGPMGTLTLTNNPGATLVLEVYCWDTPTSDIEAIRVTEESAQNDMFVPLEFNGMKKLATMMARTSAGDCIVDTWTIYMGPLAQCRATWSSHFEWNDEGVTIKSSILKEILSLKTPSVLSIELYPRSPYNMVNITVNASS